VVVRVVNALLSDPAPAQTIIASAWETFIVLYHPLISHLSLSLSLFFSSLWCCLLVAGLAD
jgi:hypothetical protein